VMLTDSVRAQGWTNFTFERLLNTNDLTSDVEITADNMLLQYAFHSTDNFLGGDVHDSFGSLLVNFQKTGPIITQPPPSTASVAPTMAPSVTPGSFSADGGAFTASWVVMGDSIRFTMKAKALGYVGIGWTAETGKGHVASDMIVGWVEGSKTTLLDTYSAKNKIKPSSDPTQDVTLVSGTEANGYTTIQFDRKLKTGDTTNDVEITASNFLFQYAYHSTDTYLASDTHDGFGTAIVNFLSDGPVVTKPVMSTPAPAGAPTAAASAAMPGVFVSTDSNFRMKWRVDATKIYFELECGTLGYCGVGWGADTKAAGHLDSDMYVAWVDSTGTAKMLDTWSTKKTVPTTDPTQDFEELKALEDGGVTSIQFARLLDTGDTENDLAIRDAPVLVQWCVHSDDDFEGGAVHDYFGKAIINFLSMSSIQVVVPSETLAMALESPNGTAIDEMSGARKGIGGLSTGQIVGIVFGAVLLLGIILALGNYLLVHIRRQASRSKA